MSTDSPLWWFPILVVEPDHHHWQLRWSTKACLDKGCALLQDLHQSGQTCSERTWAWALSGLDGRVVWDRGRIHYLDDQTGNLPGTSGYWWGGVFTIRWGYANLVMELGYLSLLKVMNIVIHTSKSKVYASPIHSSWGGWMNVGQPCFAPPFKSSHHSASSWNISCKNITWKGSCWIAWLGCLVYNLSVNNTKPATANQGGSCSDVHWRSLGPETFELPREGGGGAKFDGVQF